MFFIFQVLACYANFLSVDSGSVCLKPNVCCNDERFMVQHNFTTSLNLIYFCYLANLSLDNGFLHPFPKVMVVLFKDNAKPRS